MKRCERETIVMNTMLIFFLFLALGAQSSLAQMSLTLDQALNIAMENSPTIRRTMLDLERSSELLKAQQAALKSNFSLTLNPVNYSQDRTFNQFLSAWGSNKTKESNTTFTISQPIKQTDATLTLINRFRWQDSYSGYNSIRNKAYNNNIYLRFVQPIFTYNRTQLQIRSLELDLERTKLNFLIQRLLLERQVAQIFFNVYESKMSLDIAIEEQRNQEASYQIIKNKVDAGLSALEELYQAELNLATSKSTVQNRQVTMENALDNLKQVIGVPIAEEVAVDADIAYKPVEVNLDKAMDTGLKYRMELRLNDISIETAQEDLIRVSAQNEFKGSITVSYGITGTDEQFTRLYDKPTKSQTYGLSFDIPLWDWGEKKSRIKASKASIESARLSLADEKISIAIGVRQAYRALNNLVSQIEIARQNVRNAELTYSINLERYKNGDLTSMDLNLFQSQLSQKK